MSRMQRLKLKLDDVKFHIEDWHYRIQYPDTKREKVVVIGHLAQEAFAETRERIGEKVSKLKRA